MRICSILSRCGLAALLWLAACSGDSTSASDLNDGQISFSYSGAESGRFVARGDFENDNNREYAIASVYQRSVNLPIILYINGSMRLDNGSEVKLTILAPPVAVMTSCSPGLYGCEASATLVLSARSGSLNEDRVYATRSIEVDVTEVSEQRARGTFSMTVEQVSSTGQFTGRTIEVHSGEFDVPVVDLPTELAGPSPTSSGVSGKTRTTRSTNLAVHQAP
jgi:hypothetical protein